MQNNQYTTPILHLIKPQPGSNNFGAIMNENLNKIDTGYSKILAEYNSAVKKIEGSTGYIAANTKYYLYSVISSTNNNKLYQLELNTPIPDDNDLDLYEVTSLNNLSSGAYVLHLKYKDDNINKDIVQIKILGIQNWNDSDVVLIQHIWKESELRYEPIGTKIPYLSGGYYKPDDRNNIYTLKDGVINQSLVKQFVTDADDQIEVPQPYITYVPYRTDRADGCIYFKEVIYLPYKNKGKWIYSQQDSGKILTLPFTPVSAISSVQEIAYQLVNLEAQGYPTNISIESQDEVSSIHNQIRLEFFSIDGNPILINYKIKEADNKYYITDGSENNTFYLPEGSLIRIVVNSFTTNTSTKLKDAEPIPDEYIKTLFLEQVEV